MAIDPSISARFTTRCVLAFAAVSLSVFAVGCGSSPCEDAVEALCAKACECGRCGLAVGSENAQITLYYDDEADCQATANCEDSETSDTTFEACAADADKAECIDGAVLIPESCNEKD